MIPNAFDYRRVGSLDEALGLVGSPGTKVIAGGMSLLPLMKLRLANPERLVDIGRLAELKGVITTRDGRLAIGALTTYSELAESDARHYGLLRDALPDIGDVQVRNRGTIGGSVAHCDPASDLPAVLLALDAEIVARSKRGEKIYAADGFFTGPFSTALAEDEIVTEIRLPGPRNDAGSAYVALSQRASGYSIVGVAAVVIKEGGSAITKAGIALTGVGDAPYRARAVEAALIGNEGNAEAIAAAAAHATDGVTVAGDIHADSEYRAAMAVTYTKRAITAALVRLHE
ncbi:MAG TPA: xanthine dehydrogenase family protein subunit M [Verrucomicrobiae bacterium]|jgi:carbon-monoxide dehydrogenase medium subunit|nr:xanthine dehydrogenase family protein subunit M [Verrucomicrobiae bacterium]